MQVLSPTSRHLPGLRQAINEMRIMQRIALDWLIFLATWLIYAFPGLACLQFSLSNPALRCSSKNMSVQYEEHPRGYGDAVSEGRR